MKKIIQLFLMLLISGSISAQADYEISSARKIKVGYAPFPKDMKTKALDWTGLESSCIERATIGAWFDIKVKNDRARFVVHTGGKMGSIENPRLYLGVVKESRGVRSIEEVACKAHQGSDGQFAIEATGLSKDNQYYLLVSSQGNVGASFGVSLSDDFTPTPEVDEIVKEATKHTIFGRVVDKSGNEKSGVKVSLLDESQTQLASSTSDERGVFKFEKLEPDQVYLTKVEEADTELEVEMFLIDENGSIKSRATRIGDQLFGFGIDKTLEEYIKLLAEKDYALNVPKGKKGIVGRVVDRQTFLFGRQGIEVGLYDHEKLMSSSITDKFGLFSFTVDEADDYAVKVKCDKAKDFTEIVMVDELNVPTDVANSDDMSDDGTFSFKSLPREVVALKRMEIEDTRMQLPSDFGNMESGKAVILKNILFGYGSADLLPSSYGELNRLAEQLNELNDIKIEVAGHTDDQGTATTNQILSENRAKSVVEYLKGKGISNDRLSFKGLGETEPIASNETEEGRQKNRRVEFKVIK